MRTTPVEWINATKELPTTEEFGPYPNAIVALACRNNPSAGFSVRTAHLRFFGGDKYRPYWASDKGEDYRPIENDAWYVAFWAAPLTAPPV